MRVNWYNTQEHRADSPTLRPSESEANMVLTRHLCSFTCGGGRLLEQIKLETKLPGAFQNSASLSHCHYLPLFEGSQHRLVRHAILLF